MSVPDGARVCDPSAGTLDWCRRTGNEPTRRLCVDVRLRRVSDGVERTVVDDTGFAIEDGDVEGAVRAAVYQWTDGNYACDCNRALFFARAAGEVDPQVECGDSAFVVVAPQWLADHATPMARD